MAIKFVRANPASQPCDECKAETGYSNLIVVGLRSLCLACFNAPGRKAKP